MEIENQIQVLQKNLSSLRESLNDKISQGALDVETLSFINEIRNQINSFEIEMIKLRKRKI